MRYLLGTTKAARQRYGALRGTVGNYKGELTGSDKHFSFSLNGNPDTDHVHVFESAIDLLSFATLELLEGRDWKAETLLSLAGVFQTKREGVVPVALIQFSMSIRPFVKSVFIWIMTPLAAVRRKELRPVCKASIRSTTSCHHAERMLTMNCKLV